jgi:uncharacterized protein YuzE
MFEWDEQKAERNQAKHSVSFQFATRAFDDENRVTVYDQAGNVIGIEILNASRKIENFSPNVQVAILLPRGTEEL